MNTESIGPVRRAFCCILTLSLAVLCGPAAEPAAAVRSIRGFIDQPLPETVQARAERHRRVAERRARVPLIFCHRGASTIARENTLEAYAAAMDYGGDGCEVDVRRTADGVLVLFHDDMLDHLTNGIGTIPEVTHFELLSFKPRPTPAPLAQRARPPTFAALLALARQRAMLLHLDVKEPGLDADLAQALTEADMWDHVSAVNATTAPTLARDPRIKPVKFKGAGLFDGRHDLNPEAVKAQLALPGDAVMVDDPRLVVSLIGREAYRPVSLPRNLERDWPERRSLAEGPGRTAAARELALSRDVGALARVLAGGSTTRGGDLTSSIYLGGLMQRAIAANRLGGLRDLSPGVIDALEAQVAGRSLHPEWLYHGMDGAMAIRALASLGSKRSASAIAAAFNRVDPALEKVVNRQYGPYPLAWTDFRIKMHSVAALGELPSPASKACLLAYLRMTNAQVRELGPDYREEAVHALFRQRLSRGEITEMLRHPSTLVRGSSILQCLDRPTRARTAALRRTAPWALSLPRAR